MFTRICALEGCNVEFQTDNSRKTYCSRKHTTLATVKRFRAKRRKGGGGGGGNGGGGGPTLFDEIVPNDPQAFVPVPVIRHPAIPAKHPPEPVRQVRRRAA